ncbi:Aste57867_892 [Aphanomyces stellatus]|uniref:Aste57867_892 protein n=1 Tax=Aphanomyces stellatus TaxID=120398 RepID=A0A485K6F9_9STRA|nr:hypothetical protein As57867_000891 [Aphanomyces stellatus]VFT78116.1 Aste57867_892 [Aphanomyces stellatus]
MNRTAFFQQAALTARAPPDIQDLIRELPSDQGHPLFAHHTFDYGRQVDVIAPILAPWLEIYGTSRLPLLVDSMLHVKPIIVSFAANHGQLDILKLMYDQYGLEVFDTQWSLFVLAAAKGDMASIGFLHSVGHSNGIQFAAAKAARNGLLPVLRFLLQTYDSAVMSDWIESHVAMDVVRSNDVLTLEWLLDEWYPVVNPDELNVILSCAFIHAMDEGNEFIGMAHCLAPKMKEIQRSNSKILLFFLTTDFLLPHLDADVIVPTDVWKEYLLYAVWNEAYETWPMHTISHLVTLFNKMSCYRVGSPQRSMALKQCLEGATTHGRLDVMSWLVETQAMDPLDVQDVFASTIIGESGSDFLTGYDMAVAGFMNTHNIRGERNYMLDMVSDYIREIEDVDWDALRTGPNNSVFEYAVIHFFDVIAKEEGWEAAVAGRCFQFMLKFGHIRLDTHRVFYKLWLSMIPDDDVAQAKKHAFETEMLNQTKSKKQKAIIKLLMDEAIKS